jgi:ferric-dicitrate binding protein FerR (iron transport regulator)
MDSNRITYLYNRYLSQSLSTDEVQEFKKLLSSGDHDQALNELIDSEWIRLKNDELFNVPQENMDAAFEYIVAQPQTSKKTIGMWQRIAAAASMLLFLSTGGYFLLHKPAVTTQLVQKQDIAPGTNQATLTLANGTKIILTKALSGKLAQQGNMLVQVNGGNAIAYTVADQNQSQQQPEHNTLSTAIGEQSPYPLILADGTKVWLNAASSVSFPVAFSGKERVVEMTGEAYFEVAHNAAKPFRVVTKKQIIEDIGTAFNIKAYDNEPLAKTTLIEGAVKVSGVTLKPGDQAVSNNQNNRIEIARDINTNVTTAWKDGYFRFDLETLPAIMREFARWYNVEVIYEGKPTEQQFNMKVSRKSSLNRALQILTKGGVHYRLEGRKLIIIP